MRVSIRIVAAVLLALMALPGSTESWGRWGHYRITEHAIASLPDTLRKFFEAEATQLVAQSVEPDEARRWDEAEQYRHYIDIDTYGKPPFEELPRDYAEAVRKFGAARMDTTGTLPWVIERFTAELSVAFKGGNRDSILHAAAYLDHYVSDATVPLHTATNYDGQLTGQRGVHSRWESHLPERFGGRYVLRPGTARYLKSPRDEAFRIILESAAKVDSVLALDRDAQMAAEGSLLTAQATRERRVQLSEAYYTQYDRLLSGMVERQLQAAISAVASYWYTAWVDAGRPALAGEADPE
jgi:hypothetical protein